MGVKIMGVDEVKTEEEFVVVADENLEKIDDDVVPTIAAVRRKEAVEIGEKRERVRRCIFISIFDFLNVF